MCRELEWLEKYQRFDREKGGRNEHLELFGSEMTVGAVREFVEFHLSGDSEDGEIKGYVVG